MGHYVVYLSQSLDPRVLQRKASEVSALLDMTTEQVLHLLEQAPGKVTHPTSLERAEYIQHIFEHAGIYAEAREVEESFAESEGDIHKEAAIASEMIEHSLSVLDEGKSHKTLAKQPEKFDTLPIVASSEDSSPEPQSMAPEGYIDADAVYHPSSHPHLSKARTWRKRARALNILLMLLLLLVSLLWWRSYQQNQYLMHYNAQQQMHTLVTRSKQLLAANPNISHKQLALNLAEQANSNSSLIALFNGTGTASREWSDSRLSEINSSLLESAIMKKINILSAAMPIDYSHVRLDKGDALLVTERFTVERSSYEGGNYYIAGAFRLPESQQQQRNFNLIMILIILSLLISLLFSWLLTRALQRLNHKKEATA